MKEMTAVGIRALPKPLFWLSVALPVAFLWLIYEKGIAYMVRIWMADENYGHGFFVPLITLYLIWNRREAIQKAAGSGSPWGVAIVLLSLGLYFAGELATLYLLVHLSLWGVVVGLVFASIGTKGAKEIAFPLFYLLTMIPLPDFLYQGLSSRLQLISSALGVGCLQFVGVTAFRDGNVIDLGPIQLQVVEACSGLRYLFPLATLALILAYLFQDRLWKRAVLFLSSFPIAIFLNGFRIGMTGLLVELYGKGTAEGFFHHFSGWLLFVTSLGLLLLEMALLRRIGRRGPGGAFFEPDPSKDSGQNERSACEKKKEIGTEPRMAPTYLFSLGLLIPALFASFQIERRSEISPARELFSDFPMQVGDWKGTMLVMEPTYRDGLRFDDYLLADYQGAAGFPLNLYVAYYRSQKKGQSAHSPRTCIPGGGWEITSLESMALEREGTPELNVNRALIQKGEQKQLVYYWFQQRGRILTNEYLVKFYLFWDALTRNRTDGALVRLVAPVPPGADEGLADRHLTSFARSIHPILTGYVPE